MRLAHERDGEPRAGESVSVKRAKRAKRAKTLRNLGNFQPGMAYAAVELEKSIRFGGSRGERALPE